jgi:hypothetical protein
MPGEPVTEKTALITGADRALGLGGAASADGLTGGVFHDGERIV